MVNLRGRHPLLCLASLVALGIIAFAAPNAASGQAPTTATYTAVNDDGSWDFETPTGAESTPLALNGTLTVRWPSGVNHNAFLTGPTPSPSCMPALPSASTPPPFTSNCTFSTPGTYMLTCSLHQGMTSTVDVANATGDPPPGGGNPPPGGSNPPGGGGSGGSGGGGGGGNDPGGSPTQPGSTSIKFARKQTGTTLRGSVTAAAGAKIVVTALVSNRYLSSSRPKKVKKVSVGSQTKRSTGAKISFAVKLSKAARKALKSRDKLSVTLRIVVTPSGGKATTKTVAVKLSAD
jgi:plastocyanin